MIKKVNQPIQVCRILVFAMIATLMSCNLDRSNSGDHAKKDDQTSAEVGSKSTKSLLIGEWNFDHLSCNRDELKPHLLEQHGERGMKDFDTMIAEMSQAAQFIDYEYYEDGTLKISAKGEVVFGTYELFGDDRYLRLNIPKKRGENPPFEVIKIDHENLTLLLIQMVPLDDGTDNEVELQIHMHFEKA
jgi:hypothetical protein